ncbi:hypothetical protein [Szabonella alba]|uniref:Lipoprotein n=1 Tax=Szabonella alba TaxID=2804194 RepID=A0A8K0VDG3_9RHOB|nr:hypothetical protein [Szabonella alba]MBL4917277.1 hypothetical protein [Szabonella alba]
MKKPLLAGIAATLILGGCGFGGSRLNPLNWFGGSSETAAVLVQESGQQDARLLVQQVTDLVVERNSNGAIVRATGLPPTQGYWEAELVPRPLEDGTLVYDFRVFPPTRAQNVSTPRSRHITVGAYISNHRLQEIRQITVQGEANARSSRR